MVQPLSTIAFSCIWPGAGFWGDVLTMSVMGSQSRGKVRGGVVPLVESMGHCIFDTSGVDCPDLLFSSLVAASPAA